MRRLLSFFLATLTLTSIGFAQTAETKPEVKTEVVSRINEIIDRFAFVPEVDFKKWTEYLAEQQTKIDEAKNDEDFVAAVNEAFTKFGLSHIVVSTPKTATMRSTGKTVGIGIQGIPADGGGTTIIRIVPGAAADQAGLKVGDTIIEVDGIPAVGNKGIAGAEGTKVKLKIRHTDSKVDNYELTRRPFSTIRKEELTWINPTTAQLSVWSFMDYDRENVEALFTKAKSAKNLILDLRFNGGGAVVNLSHLAGLFLNSEQKLGHTITKAGYTQFIKEQGRKPKDLDEVARTNGMAIKPRTNSIMPYKGNLVVLINGGSGSASEMMAAAMREQFGATVVGSKSAGAVLFSVIVPASNGYTIQYPVSDYVTVAGKRLEGNGVVPDIEINDINRFRLPTEPDPCIEKALAVFERAALRDKRAADGKPSQSKANTAKPNTSKPDPSKGKSKGNGDERAAA